MTERARGEKDDGWTGVTEPFITSIYQAGLHLALESKRSTAIYWPEMVINVDRCAPCYLTSLFGSALLSWSFRQRAWTYIDFSLPSPVAELRGRSLASETSNEIVIAIGLIDYDVA